MIVAKILQMIRSLDIFSVQIEKNVDILKIRSL